MDYGNNDGLKSELTVSARSKEGKAGMKCYSYTQGNTDIPGMASSDINLTYPEVVLNPGVDSASSDSILGHL
jgi:hypothetical protein